MAAAAVSRTCAAFLTYPHEVARTRMRQGTPRYRSFWPTLSLVFHEEGFRALYRGLCTQLVRQIPNSAIMLSTYEAVVYGLTRYYAEETEFYEAPDVVETGWEDKKNHA
ncbi:unnamed protein product [Notodromas monacha]|uniref:Mitochondrial carrier protein n=1 Tax=Notodromas monacha TaxID=399045 RepID=A0A7R9GEG0_9CRUS|nr:unnamed protein product [Notodromas monacha]CAG0918232.1 unnamed protein product [Notodromas monacha]